MRLSTAEVLARCEAMVPDLVKRAPAAEAARRLHEATIADVEAADLWRMVVPASLGGHGLGVPALAQSTRVLAHGCASSAWTISFLVMHSWLLAKLPPAARAELFPPEHPYALAPAPLAPTGTVEPVQGGFLVRGRWDWATGVHHADWVLVHAVQPGPEPTSHFVVVPRSQAEVEDVWHTSGMCATGSDAVRLDSVFVPSRRAVPATYLLFGGGALDEDGMASLPVPQVLALVAAAVALGAAEAAAELYRDRIERRVLAYSAGERAIGQSAAHMRLGAVLSELDGARLRWDAAIAELDGYVGAPAVPLERRMALRLTASATVRAARSVVSAIADGAGASVYFRSSPFQRIQRDLEVLKGHVIFDWDRTTELAGKVALGLPLSPTDMV